MEGMEIRAVKIHDEYAVMEDLMRGLHENERHLWSRTALWPDIRDSYMRHVMTMQEECDGLCLIAYLNGAAAGFIFAYLEEQDDSRIEDYTGPLLYVSDGYVRPEHRRQGIYAALNRALEQHYIPMGVRRISRFTLVNNTNMRQLLEKEGYVATRVAYEKWL